MFQPTIPVTRVTGTSDTGRRYSTDLGLMFPLTKTSCSGRGRGRGKGLKGHPSLMECGKVVSGEGGDYLVFVRFGT